MADRFAEDLIALLPRLRRFARSLSGREEDADDLVQAACERALRSPGSWEPGSRLDAYMFRIVRNLWIDQIRRRRTAGPTEPVEEVVHLAGEDGRDVAESRLVLGDVRLAMAALPADQREVLTIVCVEGLSYKDAAEGLGVPIGTVMSRLSRARQALANRLEGGASGASRTSRQGR